MPEPSNTTRTGLDGCPYTMHCCGKPRIYNQHPDTETGPDYTTVYVWTRCFEKDMPVAKESAEACPYGVRRRTISKRKETVGQPDGLRAK